MTRTAAIFALEAEGYAPWQASMIVDNARFRGSEPFTGHDHTTRSMVFSRVTSCFYVETPFFA